MALWLRNDGIEDYPIDDIAITVQANGVLYDLTQKPPVTIRSSNTLIGAISRAELTLNDGLQDLTPLESLQILLSGYNTWVGAYLNDNEMGPGILWSSTYINTLLGGYSGTTHIHTHSTVTDDEPEKHFLIDDGQATEGSVYSGTYIQSLIADFTSTGHTHVEADITDLKSYVQTSYTLTTGTGLTGGGDFTSNRTLSIVPSEISHLTISDIGSNSHIQIDTHIADGDIHFVIDDSSTGTGTVFSSAEIITRLNTKEDTLGFTPEDSANKGQSDGYTPLVAGKIPDQYLPALSIMDTFVRADEAGQLALTVQQGDICVRSDTSETWILSTANNNAMSDWTQLQFPSPVTSVNDHTGIVVLDKTDIGLANVVNYLQLRVDQNLTDVVDVGVARTHLSVPSIADLQTHIDSDGEHGAEDPLWNALWLHDTEIDPTDIGSNKALVYNASTDKLEYESIVTGAMTSLQCWQARRTTPVTNFSSSWEDIFMETVDIVSGTDINLHSTNYDQIEINTTGLYYITYHCGTKSGPVYGRVRKNDTDVLRGSTSYAQNNHGTDSNSAGFIEELTAGDFLTLQFMSDGDGDMSTTLTFSIVKLDGIKGDKGDTGETGAAGTDGTNGIDGGTITVEANDVEAVSSCNTVNFEGSGVSVVDEGSGKATVTITGGGGSGGDLAAVQARRTSAFLFPEVWTDIEFDTTDVETDPDILDHDLVTNTERILIKETGLYLINFSSVLDNNSDIQHLRVYKNDTTELPGSLISSDNSEVFIGRQIVAPLSANDYLTLQGKRNAGSEDHTLGDTVFLCIKLDGVSGVSSLTVNKDGVPTVLNCNTLNFENVNITNDGSGVATITGVGGGSGGGGEYSFTFGDDTKAYYTLDSSTWTSARYFRFPGTASYTPTEAKIIISGESSGYGGEFQIFDLTNNQTIAQISDVNDESVHIETDSSLTNLPVGEAIFSLRLRRTRGTRAVRLHYFEFI